MNNPVIKNPPLKFRLKYLIRVTSLTNVHCVSGEKFREVLTTTFRLQRFCGGRNNRTGRSYHTRGDADGYSRAGT